MNNVLIREASDEDLDAILMVERLAFGSEEEAELTRALLSDESASPVHSLLAFIDDKPVGHILFTKAIINNEPDLSAQILAPLAVIPEAQKQGVGGKLIKFGLNWLKISGIDLVFVLGHPSYYPRFGFTAAGDYGLNAPYPIKAEHYEAWMVQFLSQAQIQNPQNQVLCAETMDKPEYWTE